MLNKITSFVKKIVSNDIVVRMAKTFVQAFIAVLVVGYASVKDFEGVKALVVAALAAGISAVWNALKNRQLTTVVQSTINVLMDQNKQVKK